MCKHLAIPSALRPLTGVFFPPSLQTTSDATLARRYEQPLFSLAHFGSLLWIRPLRMSFTTFVLLLFLGTPWWSSVSHSIRVCLRWWSGCWGHGSGYGKCGEQVWPRVCRGTAKNFGPPEINKCMVNSGRPTSRFAVKGLQKAEYCLCLSNLL